MQNQEFKSKLQAKVIADLKLCDIAEDETDSFDDLL